MEWYYNKSDDIIEGPVSEEKIIDLFRSGIIDKNTLIWESQMEDWKPLNKVDYIYKKTSPQPPPLPQNKNNEFENFKSEPSDTEDKESTPSEIVSKEISDLENKVSDTDSKKFSMKWFIFYLYILIPVSILNIAVDTFASNRSLPPTDEAIYKLIGTVIIIVLCYIFYGLYIKKRWGWNLNMGYLILVCISSPFVISTDYVEIVVYLAMSLFFLGFNWIYFNKRKELFDKV